MNGNTNIFNMTVNTVIYGTSVLNVHYINTTTTDNKAATDWCTVDGC
jgi:hypothetical protein